jgi:hypothetical protein
MMLALLLLASSVVLREDVSTVPPHRWRYDRFLTTDKELPVDVVCDFRLLKGGKVRVELVTDENLNRLKKGDAYEVIQASSRGGLHQEIGLPGTFAIVVWNEDETRTAEVALRLALDFSGKGANPARGLSPRRQLTVILLSFAGFLAILIVSAQRLLKAMGVRGNARGGPVGTAQDEGSGAAS